MGGEVGHGVSGDSAQGDSRKKGTMLVGGGGGAGPR